MAWMLLSGLPSVTVASQDMRFYTAALSAALEALKVRNFVQTLPRRCMPATKLYDKGGPRLDDSVNDMAFIFHVTRSVRCLTTVGQLYHLAF